jgi:hypothetical protein
MIEKLNFQSILKENEQTYFRYLEGIVLSVDEGAKIMVTKRSEDIGVRISPSAPSSFEIILQQIKRFHTMIDIQVEFSKSMKAGHNIFYAIKF